MQASKLSLILDPYLKDSKLVSKDENKIETTLNTTILYFYIHDNIKMTCQKSFFMLLKNSSSYLSGADDVEVYNFFFGNNDSYESIYINNIINIYFFE